VLTPGADKMSTEIKAMFGFEATANVNNGVQTPEQGASTQVWAAVHPDATISGQYVEGNIDIDIFVHTYIHTYIYT
jgi:hypothetical protein